MLEYLKRLIRPAPEGTHSYPALEGVTAYFVGDIHGGLEAPRADASLRLPAGMHPHASRWRLRFRSRRRSAWRAARGTGSKGPRADA